MKNQFYNNIIVQTLIEFLKENCYDDYVNLTYDILTNSTKEFIKENYLNKGEHNIFEDVIKYYEEREEYEKCKELSDRKKLLEV